MDEKQKRQLAEALGVNQESVKLIAEFEIPRRPYATLEDYQRRTFDCSWCEGVGGYWEPQRKFSLCLKCDGTGIGDMK